MSHYLHVPSHRAVASRTEGFQAGDLVTLIDRAISHSELRVLCPTQSTPFDTPPDYQCQRMSIESGSDLSMSLELSTSPQKSHLLSPPPPPPPPPFTPPGRHFDLTTSQVDSGISSPVVHGKKLSVVSASSITPSTPRTSGRTSFTRVSSLSQMVLTVHDFVTALEGFVPVSLRGLPLHTSSSVGFSHVGGLESTKQALRETLLWPTKVQHGKRVLRGVTQKFCCGGTYFWGVGVRGKDSSSRCQKDFSVVH